MLIEIRDNKVILNGVEYTREAVAAAYLAFPPVTLLEIKTAIFKMCSRKEGAIQDEVAVELGVLEKNRLTSTFREMEVAGELFVSGKRASARTGGLGNVYFVGGSVE